MFFNAGHVDSLGTHFTCFTGTKVQILTQKPLLGKGKGFWGVGMFLRRRVQYSLWQRGWPVYHTGRVGRESVESCSFARLRSGYRK